MDESPGQIEDHIRSTRGALESNLRELEHKVKDATNWRVQFERHPSVFLGAAFAGGMLLAAAFGSRHSSLRRDQEQNSRDHGAIGSKGSGSAAHTLWNKVKSELIAVAGAQIGTLIREVIPAWHSADKAAHESTFKGDEDDLQPHTGMPASSVQ